MNTLTQLLGTEHWLLYGAAASATLYAISVLIGLIKPLKRTDLGSAIGIACFIVAMGLAKIPLVVCAAVIAESYGTSVGLLPIIGIAAGIAVIVLLYRDDRSPSAATPITR